jgi:hypothetical protein
MAERAGKKLLSHRHCTSEAESLLVGERHILELIAIRRPLSDILNALCDAIDVQIGSMISLIVLSDEEEHDIHMLARSVGECGLYIFCCAAILSETDDLLGSLKMHCCDPRSPTANEFKLIERVTHLAAIAIQSQNGCDNDGGLAPRRWNITVGRRSTRGVSFIN